jgi:hypothetical protein
LEILKKIVKGNIFLDKTEETEKDKKERQIVSFLDSVCKGEWEYRMDNGIQKVDVDGGVKIWDIELENNRLPVKFGKIKGILSLNGTNLDTLEGIPDSTSGGGISIFVGIIKSLEGFPKDYFDGSV